jgi:membrane carboxypeptidase/penicillin-binding protein
VAVRVGFDDGRSLGRGETGGRVALPMFEDVMMQAYRLGVVGPVPAFPPPMEERISRYLAGDTAVTPSAVLSGTARTP